MEIGKKYDKRMAYRSSFRTTPKTGRNELCHCGSGKKYKKCCERKDEYKSLGIKQR